ncbi:helix-turn-helix transcriptional regulator [Cyanobium sp. AMD-g]|nr:helix-turn-helix transcriptional regulator [Cyanobium sp. AMD-g]
MSNTHFPHLQHPEAGRFPNPLVRRFSQIEDPQACIALLQGAIAGVDLSPLDSASSWWYYGTNLRLGSIVATAWSARPMRAAFAARQNPLILLGYGGRILLRQASRTWRCGPGCGLLMDRAACAMESSVSSGVAFVVSRDRLLKTALTMAGCPQPPEGWEQTVAQTHGWSPPEDPAAPSLLAALGQTMQTAGQLAGHGEGLLDSLQFDDQIYRLLAAMVLPELREDRPLERLRLRQRDGRDAFDELIDYIKENLAKPLTLTDLEARSHYSRRALQYAFAERMGCRATEWIKHQRLDQARRRLENPNPEDTVGSIARECGYRSLGLFSVDFQQRFHVKPSVLLRESR